ncbi:MAG: hypothetical protein D6722_12740 [Bacteroidetes bacterium]|nr:MAG: hypothetical protein D6722_12740 [Bacteroidota bacterium]
MKAILFWAILSLSPALFVSPRLNTPTTSPRPAVDVMGKVDISLDVGRKSKGCSGFGICRFEVSLKDRGMGFLTMEGDQPKSFTVYRKALDEETIQEYFSGRYFVVEEAYSTRLKIDGKVMPVEFKAGKYPIQTTSESFNIGMPDWNK